jgi:hypothetical protein
VALFTVIGDLVRSRRAADRAALQERLGEILSVVNARVETMQPFEPTVGDEFQGACATLADAVLATLLVRVGLHPHADVRCGIGSGEVTVYDDRRTPLLQDGPGWWSAREAIESISGSRDARRTCFVGPDAATTNAFLVCRDQIVRRLNDRSVRMLGLALAGHTQREIAEIEGIWPSAVSQQFARGVSAVLASQRLLSTEEGAG